MTENEFTSKDLWQSVKPLVRQHKTKDGCLIFDDSIVEKKYMAENAPICWLFDHSTSKAVKGINLLTALKQGDNGLLTLQIIDDGQATLDESIVKKEKLLTFG